MYREETGCEFGYEQTIKRMLRERQERLPDGEGGVLVGTGTVYEAMLVAYAFDQSWPLKIRQHNWSPEKRREFCRQAIHEFATLPQWHDRTSESLTILVQFGETAIRELLDGVYDEDRRVRSFAVSCIEHLLRVHVVQSKGG